MCTHTVAWGVRGHAPSSPPQIFGQKWCDLVQSGGVSKYVITNLKINNFKEKNPQENLIAIFLSQVNLDEHGGTKINTFIIYKGGLGASPPEAEEIFKKSNKMDAFPIFIVLFGKAP